MSTEALGRKSNGALLSQLKQAAKRTLTPHEVFEQRVSFAYSSLDSKSNVTKDGVRKQLKEQMGEPS